MTPATTRVLRRGLLVLVAGVIAAVAWSIRKPTLPPPVSLPAADPAGGVGTSVGELVLRRFKGEHEGFVLKAKKTLSQEGAETRFQGVDVEVHYVARGEAGKAHITADECRYNPAAERAVFQGSVHVVTEDGFELDSDSLIYRGDKGLVKTADPAALQAQERLGYRHGHGVSRRWGHRPAPRGRLRAHRSRERSPDGDPLGAGERGPRRGHPPLRPGRAGGAGRRHPAGGQAHGEPQR